MLIDNSPWKIPCRDLLPEYAGGHRGGPDMCFISSHCHPPVKRKVPREMKGKETKSHTRTYQTPPGLSPGHSMSLPGDQPTACRATGPRALLPLCQIAPPSGRMKPLIPQALT